MNGVGATTASRGAGAESGFVLPAVLIVLAVLSIGAISSMTMTREQFRASHSVREAAVALFAAQAGAEVMIASMDTLGLDSLVPSPGDSAVLAWQTLPNGARFRATIRRTDAGNAPTYSVNVEGRGRGASATPRWIALTLDTGGGSRFPWAVFGRDQVKIGGSGTTVGPVGSNGNIELNDFVDGDVTAGGTVSGTEHVGGALLEGASHVPLDTIPCPVQAWGPAPIGGDLDTLSGDFDGAGGATFPAGTYYFHDFNVGDNLQFTPGSSVEIYIAREFVSTGGAIVNPNRAADVIFYGCGSDDKDWRYTGGGDVYAGMYAPTHVIKSTGAGVLYGSVIGREFIKTGPGRVVYDSSLTVIRKDGSRGGRYVVIEGSWSAMAR